MQVKFTQQGAGHESARTIGRHDCRDGAIALDEVERVLY
jgi:hypothetical protein